MGARDLPSAVICALGLAGAAAAASAEPSVDALIGQFGATAPAGRVTLDAWVQARGEGRGRELVVVLQPEGETRLVADPGITLTPQERPGLVFDGPLPHRQVDPAREYFEPPASLRLPFSATDDQPIRIVVEYAWCVVDYQCYLGEETLSVANRID